MDWAHMLAYITGTVDQELLLRNEYLVAENRILKAQLKTPLRLTDAERATLAEIAHRLSRQALEEVANVMKPDTIMGWYRKLVARKFDGSKSRRYPGRPRLLAACNSRERADCSPAIFRAVRKARASLAAGAEGALYC